MSENIENTINEEELNHEEEPNQEKDEYNPLSNIRYKAEFNPKTKNGKFKVDCWNNEKNGSLTPRDINKKSHEVERALWGEYEMNSEKTEREFDEMRRMIDSRTDKLYDKIHSLEGTIAGLIDKKDSKQLLTD